MRRMRLLAVASVVGLGGCGLSAVGLPASDDAGTPKPDATLEASSGDEAPDQGSVDGEFGVDSHADVSSDSGVGPDTGLREAGPPDSGIPDAGVDARDAGVVFAATCAELNLPDGTQTVTLYLEHSPSKSWTATCVTSGGSSKTYLPLPGGNESSYPLGGCATPVHGSTGVVTTWSRVLFDPTTLTVDTSDLAGSTSTGATFETSGNGSVMHEYDAMMFASARSCMVMGPAKGSVNLTGTQFAVDSSQTFLVQGSSASGSGTTTGEQTALTVEGFPAGISPCTSVSDYYTDVGGTCLKLVYAP